MAESRHSQRTVDDEPRSLEALDFYRPLQQTDIGSSHTYQLVADSGIGPSHTDFSRDDSEGTPTLDGTSPAQTLATKHDQTQDLVNHYPQLKEISHLSSDAADTYKLALGKYLKGRTGIADIVNELQNEIRLFKEALRNSEDLLNKIQFSSSGTGIVKEETGTTDTKALLVTALTSSHSLQPQDQETVPVYDVSNQHLDTLRSRVGIIDSDDEEMYDNEEPCFGASSAALSNPTAKDDTLAMQKSIQRILANHRVRKEINIELVDHLLPLSKSVGAVMKKHYSEEATATAGVSPTWTTHLHGTCFRLGSQYVLTNKHVADLANLTDCSNASVIFNNYNKVPIQFPIEQIKFECCDPSLDYSVLEVSIPNEHFQEVQQYLPGLGHLVKELGKGQKVTLIGHPNGDPLSMDPNCPVVSPLQWYQFLDNSLSEYDAFLLRHPGRALYRSTFGQGSSGSPVFDNNGYLVGMHTRGFPTDGQSQVEQMIRMTAIQKEIELYQPDLCKDLFFSQFYQSP